MVQSTPTNDNFLQLTIVDYADTATKRSEINETVQDFFHPALPDALPALPWLFCGAEAQPCIDGDARSVMLPWWRETYYLHRTTNLTRRH